MKYTFVKNPKWANYTKTAINCEVNFDGVEEEFVPFTATLDDIYEHGKEIFTKCVSGDFGVLEDYTPPANITGSEALQRVRNEREYKLNTQVDPIVSNPLRWADITAEEQTALAEYRRALLDITTNYPNVYYAWDEDVANYVAKNIVWPVSPSDPMYTHQSGIIPISEV